MDNETFGDRGPAGDEGGEGAAADPVAALREALRRSERPVPAAGLGRLWRTGRSAAGMAAAVLGGRLRGRGDGLAAADLEAVVRMVTQLGELKGVAMKVGQILGYVDPSLPEELRGLLSILQTTSPASPFSVVEETLRAALGERADALLAGLERAPVAVASIGQVHRGRLPGGVEVAVKVRHPGIAEALRGDFRAAAVAPAFAAAFGAGGGVRGFVDEARTAMLEECDFLLEAKRQGTFRRLLADDEAILVPAVEPALCAEAVLTTRWAPGRSLDAFLAGAPPQALRDRVGAALFRFYIGTLYRHGLFHADPHPGNYALRDDGRVVVYDFGCVRAFDRGTVAAFARLVAAVRQDDEEATAAALSALGAEVPADRAARAHVRTLLRSFFAPLLLPGPRPIEAGAGAEARQLMRDKRAIMRLSLPGKLLFLFRLRFGLYAVLSRLGAVADWAALEGSWASAALAP